MVTWTVKQLTWFFNGTILFKMYLFYSLIISLQNSYSNFNVLLSSQSNPVFGCGWRCAVLEKVASEKYQQHPL